MLDGITGKTLSTPLPIIMVGPSEAKGSTKQMTTAEEGEGPNSADKASLSNPLFFTEGLQALLLYPFVSGTEKKLDWLREKVRRKKVKLTIL